MGVKILRHLGLWAAAVLLSLSVVLGVLVANAVLMQRGNLNYFSISRVAAALTQDSGGYRLSEQGQAELAAYGCWAMLLDETGTVIWSQNKPADLPAHYTLAEVASFTRWYLRDYPVSVWQYGAGVLVAGAPKNSAWKYSLTYAKSEFANLLLLVPVLFFVLLTLTLLLGRRSFQKEAARRDVARSRWIDGISHDIRTPLSIIMGYAGDWAADTTLPPERRRQARAMVNASTGVKSLVADLNLTMRLDYEMQPLRKETVSPAALLRTVAADALNSGLATDLVLDIAPAAQALHLSADPVLLRRALVNLIQNAARHGEGTITLRLLFKKHRCVFVVENKSTSDAAALLGELNQKKAPPQIARDGTAAHGTGLRLVQQIAKAHHGKLLFSTPNEGKTLRAELRLPVSGWPRAETAGQGRHAGRHQK